jgi:hypothetical protein
MQNDMYIGDVTAYSFTKLPEVEGNNVLLWKLSNAVIADPVVVLHSEESRASRQGALPLHLPW